MHTSVVKPEPPCIDNTILDAGTASLIECCSTMKDDDLSTSNRLYIITSVYHSTICYTDSKEAADSVEFKVGIDWSSIQLSSALIVPINQS